LAPVPLVLLVIIRFALDVAFGFAALNFIPLLPQAVKAKAKIDKATSFNFFFFNMRYSRPMLQGQWQIIQLVFVRAAR
jgi:hypothetical protein